MRILEIDEIKSVPYTPTSHPFVERLIGTIRRGYLDQTFFWGRRDLARKLDDFKHYYNEFRVHSSLAAKTPSEKAEQVEKSLVNLDNFDWKIHCKGLFHTPVAA
jgi:transposase InsO family protein